MDKRTGGKWGLVFVGVMVGATALAQDAVPRGGALAEQPLDLPIPASALPARAGGPDPTSAQVELMREADAISDAAHQANELEAAERMAPIDLAFGIPDGRS